MLFLILSSLAIVISLGIFIGTVDRVISTLHIKSFKIAMLLGIVIPIIVVLANIHMFVSHIGKNPKFAFFVLTFMFTKYPLALGLALESFSENIAFTAHQEAKGMRNTKVEFKDNVDEVHLVVTKYRESVSSFNERLHA